MSEKKMTIKLAPGAFDNVPEDEQQDLFDDLQAMLDDGSLFENSEPIDMDTLEEEDPELYAILTQGAADISKLQ